MEFLSLGATLVCEWPWTESNSMICATFSLLTEMVRRPCSEAASTERHNTFKAGKRQPAARPVRAIQPVFPHPVLNLMCHSVLSRGWNSAAAPLYLTEEILCHPLYSLAKPERGCGPLRRLSVVPGASLASLAVVKATLRSGTRPGEVKVGRKDKWYPWLITSPLVPTIVMPAKSSWSFSHDFSCGEATRFRGDNKRWWSSLKKKICCITILSSFSYFGSLPYLVVCSSCGLGGRGNLSQANDLSEKLESKIWYHCRYVEDFRTSCFAFSTQYLSTEQEGRKCPPTGWNDSAEFWYIPALAPYLTLVLIT